MHRVRRSRMTANDKGAIWDRWQQGQSLRTIAHALDRNPGSVFHVVAARGGVPPEARSRAPRVLRVAEREEISRGLATGLSFRQISAKIGRAPSTVTAKSAGRAVVSGIVPQRRTPTHGIAPCGHNAVDGRSILSCVRAWRRNSPWTGRRSKSQAGSSGPLPRIRTCRCRTRRSTAACSCRAVGCSRHHCSGTSGVDGPCVARRMRPRRDSPGAIGRRYTAISSGRTKARPVASRPRV